MFGYGSSCKDLSKNPFNSGEALEGPNQPLELLLAWPLEMTSGIQESRAQWKKTFESYKHKLVLWIFIVAQQYLQVLRL